jgi:hypothetical protein
MAGDLSQFMIDRPAYCLKHSHRWAAQMVSGRLSWFSMFLISDFEGPRDLHPACNGYYPSGY